MKRLLFLLLVLVFASTAYGGVNDRFSKIELNAHPNNYIIFPEISAPSGNPTTNYGWLYVKDNAGTSTLYFEDDGGNVTAMSPAATAWSDIGDATADSTITFDDNEVTTLTFADTNEDMFNIQGLGAFGDVSVVRLEQKTGNPTDGTVLEVVAADANVDPLVISASGKANALVVGQNTGVVTIAGVAEGTTALEITAGDINLTDGDVNVPGGDATFGEDVTITGTLSAGTIAMDAVTAATPGATLALNGEGAGGVNIGATSTGGITLSRVTTMADGVNFTIGEGSATIDNDAADETALTITSDATTTGGGINVTSGVTTASGKAVSVTADAVTTGDVLYLESSAAGMTTGNFINAYNGAATVFEVGLYGATTIAGNASTDIITVTSGDIQITAGDIDLDNGQLLVDSNQDLANNITRNYNGAGTGPVLTVSDDHTASTNVALSVNQDGTAGSTAVQIVHDGDNPSISLTAGAARTGNVIDVDMANQLAEAALYVDGAWTGASDEGLVWVNTTAAATVPAGQVVRLDQNGTGQHAAAIEGSVVYVADAATAPAAGTSYAVSIDATNIEALHVDTGTAVFDEIATFTAGVDSDGDIDADFSANTEEVNITADVTDYAAGSGIVTVYDDSTGQTNASYLLRLAREANGDAQDHFILCEDNSDGTANNGDDMFAVDSGGAVTMAGDLTANGNIVGDGATTLTGTIDTTEDYTGAGNTLSIAECGSTFTNNGDADGSLHTLPEASTAIGCEYCFAVMAAQNLNINPNDGVDQILGLTDAAGDSVQSSTAGDYICLKAVGANAWVVSATNNSNGNADAWADAN